MARPRLRALWPDGDGGIRLPSAGETIRYGRLRLGGLAWPLAITVWPRHARPYLPDGEARWHPGAGGIWLRIDIPESPPCAPPTAAPAPALALAPAPAC